MSVARMVKYDFPHLKNVCVSVVPARKTSSSIETVPHEQQHVLNNDDQTRNNSRYAAEFPCLASDHNTQSNRTSTPCQNTSIAEQPYNARDSLEDAHQTRQNNEEQDNRDSDSAPDTKYNHDTDDANNSSDLDYSDGEYEARIPQNSQATTFKRRKYRDYHCRERPGKAVRLNDAPANGKPSWYRGGFRFHRGPCKN